MDLNLPGGFSDFVDAYSTRGVVDSFEVLQVLFEILVNRSLGRPVGRNVRAEASGP